MNNNERHHKYQKLMNNKRLINCINMCESKQNRKLSSVKNMSMKSISTKYRNVSNSSISISSKQNGNQILEDIINRNVYPQQ